MFYTYAPQDVLADEGGSAQEMMEQAAAAGVELEVEELTWEIMSMKQKGLTQQLKPSIAKLVEDGMLSAAVDRANTPF